MSFLQALDTAIAMTLIYFLLSLVVSALTEGIATLLKWRSETLSTWIVGALHDPTAIEDFYNHPLIRTLEQVSVSNTETPTADNQKPQRSITVTAVRKPSYIPARTFAVVVLDLLKVRTGTLAEAHSALSKVSKENPYYELARTVAPILEGATSSIAKSQKSLETWFDSSMDRVSGWYKRHISWITLSLSLFIAVLANASTIELIHVLWNDQALRQAFVAQAQIMTEEDGQRVCEFSQQAGCISLDDTIGNLPLPLGWNFCTSPEVSNTCIRIRSQNSSFDLSPIGQEAGRNLLGWLLTAILLSFGSRFWFDALSKLVNIRLAGQKPSESEASDKKGT